MAILVQVLFLFCIRLATSAGASDNHGQSLGGASPRAHKYSEEDDRGAASEVQVPLIVQGAG